MMKLWKNAWRTEIAKADLLKERASTLILQDRKRRTEDCNKGSVNK